MKKKIFQFSFPLGRLVLPFMFLGMFLFTTSSVNAQSYKSYTDASVSVKEALLEIMPFPTSTLTADQKLKAAKARVYNLFLDDVHVTQDSKASYATLQIKLKNYLVADSQASVSNAIDPFILNASNDLLQLITN